MAAGVPQCKFFYACKMLTECVVVCLWFDSEMLNIPSELRRVGKSAYFCTVQKLFAV